MRPLFDNAVSWTLRFLVVIVASLALVATACGNDDSDSGDSAPAAPLATGTAESMPDSDGAMDDEEVEIRVAYFNSGGQTEVDFREEQAAAFEAMHPNVTVDMEPISDWMTTVAPQIASGTLADVIWGSTDDGYGQMVARNAFTSIQPYIDSEGYDLSLWPESMLQHFSNPEGDLLVLPYANLSFNFLYYNKNLFDEAGLDYPDASWSIDDLIDAARALSVPDEQWGFGFAWDDLFLTWMRMYGCEFSNDATYPTDYTYNDPTCVEAVEDLDELSREGVINWELGAQWGGLAPGDDTGEGAFSGGHVAMLLSGTWEAPTIAANSGGAFEFDAVPAPLAPGGTIQGAASGFGVSSDSDHPEWAWEYVKHISGPEGQEAEARLGLGQSPIATILDRVYCVSDAPPANKCEVAKSGAANTKWEPLADAWGPGFWDVMVSAAQGGFIAGSPPDWQALLDEAVETSRQAAPLS